MLKVYPESVLSSSFPYSNFEEVRVDKKDDSFHANISISVREYLTKQGESGWINGEFAEHFVTELLLITDKNSYENINVQNYEEIKKKSRVYTKITTKEANNSDLPVEISSQNYEIFKQIYKFNFPLDVSQFNFLGLVTVTKIDANSYSLMNPGTFFAVNSINASLIEFDKKVLVESGMVEHSKNFKTYTEKGQEYLWYGKPIQSVENKVMEFNIKDQTIFSEPQPYINILAKPSNTYKTIKPVYFSDLFYGIDEKLNIKGTFFFDVYEYLINNSVIYPKVNKEYFSREMILPTGSILTSFDMEKEVYVQNKPSYKKYDKSIAEINDKISFSINKSLDFNLGDGIYAIDFIDYNENNFYNDKEFSYNLKLGVLDTIYINSNSVLIESQNSLKVMKEYSNFLYGILYIKKGNTYKNYDFLSSKFTNSFKQEFEAQLINFNLNNLLNSFIKCDFLLNNKRNRLNIEKLKKFVDVEYASFDDIQFIIKYFESLITRLDDIIKAQKSGAQYSVINKFKETLFLDSSLYAISYATENESGEYSINYSLLSSTPTLPLLSPQLILVRDFSDKGFNDKYKFVFSEIFKKDVKEILNKENIDLYDDLVKNIALKLPNNKPNKVIKKTINTSLPPDFLSRNKLKILNKLSKQTYNSDTKKPKITSKISFNDTLKSLSKEKKQTLFKSIFGNMKVTNQQLENQLQTLSSNYFDNIFNKTTSLADNTRKVEVYENPYINLLHQIQNGEVVKMEYLSGFRKINNKILLKYPMWQSLTTPIFKEKIISNGTSGKQSLCKLSVIKPDDFLINKDNLDMNLTKLYQNFILKYR